MRIAGLGKTVITLTAIRDLKYDYLKICKVLVIAPKRVAEDTWSREAAKWDHLKHLLRVSKVLGTLNQRIAALQSDADVYVINRENVQWLCDYLGHAWPFDMVVVDESSSFKNHRAKRFRALRTQLKKIRRMVILTGTPTPKGLIDLWPQLYLLDQGARLGRSITQYRNEYFIPDRYNPSTMMIYSYKPKQKAYDIILNKISDICISLRAEDYLTMPKRIDDIRRVILPPKIREQYNRFERELFLSVDEAELDAGSAAVLSGKLQQFCNGSVYDDAGRVVHVHDCKVEAFMEMIEELQGKPVLVFYNYQHDKDSLLKALQESDVSVSELKNSASIEAWNSGKVDVMLAHPASAAYGLNLQEGGSHIIWYGLNWSLELYQQANARLYRQGQKDTVVIHHLIVEGCRDEDIMKALGAKGVTQDSLLNSLKAKIRAVKGGANA